jgi:hypothetical protein
MDEKEMLEAQIKYADAYAKLQLAHPNIDWEAHRQGNDANRKMFALFSKAWGNDETHLFKAYWAFKQRILFHHDAQA